MISSFKKVQSDDRVVNMIQDNVGTVLEQIIDQQILNGNILKNVDLISGQTTAVNHGLSTILTGWVLIRMRGNAVVWDSQDTNSLPERTLLLNCSTSVSVDLLVF